jgi:hypothetical protein
MPLLRRRGSPSFSLKVVRPVFRVSSAFSFFGPFTVRDSASILYLDLRSEVELTTTISLRTLVFRCTHLFRFLSLSYTSTNIELFLLFLANYHTVSASTRLQLPQFASQQFPPPRTFSSLFLFLLLAFLT